MANNNDGNRFKSNEQFICPQTNLSMSRRILNILNAETVFDFIRKRKSFLKSNSLTYNRKDSQIQEEDSTPDYNLKTTTSRTSSSVLQKSSSTTADLFVPAASSEATKKNPTNKTKFYRRISHSDNIVADKNRNRIILQNKPPIWNENSQVYQLDFGGRVTQESAKNFQVEYCGKQVMQFGRIDTNAYTLDFEWPFTAIQAFSIALANITQRLK